MTAVDFAAHVKGAKRRGGGEWWDGRCPAHDDGRASLSWADGDRGVIVKCQRGCTFSAIAAAAGVGPRDLFYAPGNGHHAREDGNGSAPGRVVATYDYRDASGAVRHQTVRFDPKGFSQRRSNGRGGWIWNLKGIDLVLYRLPELAEQRVVYVVEGEKDCDALWRLGIAATTNAMGAGKWEDSYTETLARLGVECVVVIPDNDAPGEAHARAVARSCLAAGLRVKVLRLPDLADRSDVSDWLGGGHTAGELEALADAVPPLTLADVADPVSARDGAATGPELRREGADLVLVCPDGIRFSLTAIRDGRDGIRGELTATQDGRRLSWGSLPLSSTSARETLRKKIEAVAPGPPWGEYLEEAAFRFTQAGRQGEPLVTLTGTVTSPTRELLPRLLYDGEPTLIFGDGDTGKSLVALALAVAVQSGAALPFGLKPARAVPAAYLDWETTRDTLEARVALIAAGLGVDVPAIVYKRMTRPLVDEAAVLAADFARRGIGFVVIDSKMFAVAGGDGAAFHEPITAFYNALRLFSPAASLVLNHITGADARGGGPSRPFGGAFAFNGPRLIWEARRDPDVTDATAVAFTCRKANNLPRRPDPFGLRFQPGAGTITVYPFDLAEAAPQIVAGASLSYHVRLALARGVADPETIARDLADLGKHASVDTIKRLVRLERQRAMRGGRKAETPLYGKLPSALRRGIGSPPPGGERTLLPEGAEDSSGQPRGDGR